MEELKVTSPEEYAEKVQRATASESAGFLHTLTKTGATVRLRRVEMEALALVGSLPMSLVAAATAQEKDASKTESKSKAKRKENPTQEEIERGNNNLIFMRQMVVENCIEPSIRYFEGIGVYFVNAEGKQITRVHPDDFMEMFAVITGEAGQDGLDSFRNRKTRRASASKSRRKTLRNRSVGTGEREPASA